MSGGLQVSAYLDVPKPSSLVPDASDGVDAARQRFAKRRRFLSLTSLHRRRSKRSLEPKTGSVEAALEPNEDVAATGLDANPINLVAASPTVSFNDESHDHYEWAVVYENQRG